jgi:hypothetical protein
VAVLARWRAVESDDHATARRRCVRPGEQRIDVLALHRTEKLSPGVFHDVGAAIRHHTRNRIGRLYRRLARNTPDPGTTCFQRSRFSRRQDRRRHLLMTRAGTNIARKIASQPNLTLGGSVVRSWRQR